MSRTTGGGGGRGKLSSPDMPVASADSDRAAGGPIPLTKPGAYAWYALGVLLLVYTLNFVDRNLLTILAEDVKRELHLTDVQIGSLYGTAFAVFYCVFSVPFARLA